MGAQPKPRSGVASLARQDLPSCAAVMLTCAVCSLLRASCLFNRSHPPGDFATNFDFCNAKFYWFVRFQMRVLIGQYER